MKIYWSSIPSLGMRLRRMAPVLIFGAVIVVAFIFYQIFTSLASSDIIGTQLGHEALVNKHRGLLYKGCYPSPEHEYVKQKLALSMSELWNYLWDQLPRINQTESIISHVREQHRTMMADLKRLELDAAQWKEQEHLELQNLMQRRLHYLQNPEDCVNAKKLLCHINQHCGYGCQLHHAVYCFMAAYGLQRTLIIESQAWSHVAGGWQALFLPISFTCSRLPETQSAVLWQSEESNRNDLVVELSNGVVAWDAVSQLPQYRPLSVPEDLYSRLSQIHGDPAVWFIGQFLACLLKPQARLSGIIKEYSEQHGFRNPIVGIQIRRTDKISGSEPEAKFHSLDDYMFHVEEWFKTYELSANKTLQRWYPHYDFLGNVSISQAADLGQRQTELSLLGFLLDIHLLSRCDFLVCTFSSNVCRLAYAIMQSLRPDASGNVRSLDDIYWFSGQHKHTYLAIYRHRKTAQGEISLELGDYIHVYGNHWNGFSKGKNLRTGEEGVFPTYKAKDVPIILNYPTYPEANDIKN